MLALVLLLYHLSGQVDQKARVRVMSTKAKYRGNRAMSRGGGDSKVENLRADFRFFFACMLPVGAGKNKNSRGRKKNGHHGHYFGGLVGKKKFSTKIPNIIQYFTVKYIAAPSKWL